MRILHHRKFVRNYRKRIAPDQKLADEFERRLKLFIENPHHPLLKNHKLEGKKSQYRAFWLTGDFRVVYEKIGNDIRLYDVGTHNQVY